MAEREPRSPEEALAHEAAAQATRLGTRDFCEATVAWRKRREGVDEGV